MSVGPHLRAFFAFLLLPKCFFFTAPAHPHVTLVAVYPALSTRKANVFRYLQKLGYYEKKKITFPLHFTHLNLITLSASIKFQKSITQCFDFFVGSDDRCWFLEIHFKLKVLLQHSFSQFFFWSLKNRVKGGHTAVVLGLKHFLIMHYWYRRKTKR